MKDLVKETLNRLFQGVPQIKDYRVGYGTYAGNGRATVDEAISGIPANATILSATILNTPNPHWVRGVVSADTTRVVVWWHNEYTDAIMGDWHIRIAYRI